MQQKKIARGVLHRKEDEISKLYCMNSSKLSWEEAMSTLVELQNGSEKFKLSSQLRSIEEAILIGTMLEGTTAVLIEELRIYLPHRYKSNIRNVEPLINNF